MPDSAVIISHSKKFICFNPPKTGSGYRELLLNEYADISIRLEKRNLCEKVNRHESLLRAIDFFEARGWDIAGYYKFTFVRNPWQRLVSYFNMVSQERSLEVNKGNFDFFIKLITGVSEGRGKPIPYQLQKEKQEEYFLKKDVFFLDYVGSSESHEEDMINIAMDIGIHLPKIGLLDQGRERHHAQINEFWTDETIRMVQRYDNKTIELKDYIFGQ